MQKDTKEDTETSKKVLIITSKKDAPIALAFEKVLSLLGFSITCSTFDQIVTPPKDTIRYPSEAGGEWEVSSNQSGENPSRKPLHNFGVYVIEAMSQDSTALPLWILTVRGAENIFRDKKVIVVGSGNRHLKDTGVLILADLFDGRKVDGIREFIRSSFKDTKEDLSTLAKRVLGAGHGHK